MSESLLDFDTWPAQIISASIPANNNARRAEVLAANVVSATTTAQPALTSPADDRKTYIIPASATGGQWSSLAVGSLAIFIEGTWTEFDPYEGLRKFVVDEGEDWQYTSGAWASASAGAGVASLNGHTGAVVLPVPIGVACSDETTALTASTAKVTFRMPYAMTLLSGAAGVRASLVTAQTSGSIFTVDINEGGSSILSTKLTIDNTEKTSATAATPPVISDTSLADDAEISVDIDQIGDGTAKGLKIWLIGYPT